MPPHTVIRTALISLPFINIAEANVPTDISQLEPVTVQSSAVATTTPWTTHTDRKELDALQIQDWEDLGRRAEPGVNFNRRTQSINIRGLDETRVTTRIDGIRQPWLNDGARGLRGGLTAFDFNSLWALDIVRGADSSMAGSGALGAQVKMQTLNPADLFAQDRNFATLFKTDLSSVDQSAGTNVALAGRYHSTDWLIQAGVRQGAEQRNMGDWQGYGANRTATDPASYQQQSYLVKLQQQLSDGHRVGVTGEYFERDGDINNLSSQGVGTPYLKNRNQTHELNKRERLSLEYGYQSPWVNSFFDSAKAQLYWQRVSLGNEMQAMRKPDQRAKIIRGDPFHYAYPFGGFSRTNSMSESMYGIDGEISKQLTGMIGHHLTVGGEWFGTRVTQYSSGSDNCPTVVGQFRRPFGPRACDVLHTNRSDVPPVNGEQWALWAQDIVSFGQTGFTLTPALRYDHYEQQPQNAVNNIWGQSVAPNVVVSKSGQLSPKLLASLAVHEQATLYAQYATGFNAPSATQLYSRYGSYGSYLNVGNPALKPEISRGYEFGTRLGNDKRDLILTYFDNYYQNLIENNVPLGTASATSLANLTTLYPLGVTTSANIEQARIYGLEARGQMHLDHGWRIWSSLAWAVGRDQQTQQYLNSVAPLTAIFGLAYRHEQWGAQAMLTAVAARTNVKVPAATALIPIADYQVPGYGLVDMSVYWRPTFISGLQLQLGVYNVFDKRYWNALNMPSAGAKPAALAQLTQRPLDWYSEPGRNYRLTVTYQY